MCLTCLHLPNVSVIFPRIPHLRFHGFLSFQQTLPPIYQQVSGQVPTVQTMMNWIIYVESYLYTGKLLWSYQKLWLWRLITVQHNQTNNCYQWFQNLREWGKGERERRERERRDREERDRERIVERKVWERKIEGERKKE